MLNENCAETHRILRNGAKSCRGKTTVVRRFYVILHTPVCGLVAMACRDGHLVNSGVFQFQLYVDLPCFLPRSFCQCN